MPYQPPVEPYKVRHETALLIILNKPH